MVERIQSDVRSDGRTALTRIQWGAPAIVDQDPAFGGAPLAGC